MKVVTCITEKGGVGKTTLAVNLAGGLAQKGYKVLLIDSDEQGHVAKYLGLKKEPGFFDLMQRNAPWRDVLRIVPSERYQLPGRSIESTLYLLPGDITTRALPYTMQPNSKLLRTRLSQLEHYIDFAVIDTGPAASLLHILIYRATQYVICPTVLEELSFDGLQMALMHIEQANEDRRDRREQPIQVLGIVPTMTRDHTAEHKLGIDQLRNAYGDLVWDSIRERILWAEACGNHRTVFGYGPGSEAASDCWNFIERVEATILGVQHEPA